MKTIIVDDEPLSVEQFRLECSDVAEIEVAGVFTSPVEALHYAEAHPVEFALLDVEMPGMNGIELAQRLRALHPRMIIIFVSAYSEYVLDALRMKGDYYVLKPYSREDILDALTRARLLAKGQEKRVRFHTFGRFEVYIDGVSVHFPNAKSRELLALCVDHNGGMVTMEEAVDKLWPEKDYDSRAKALYRKAVIGIHEVLHKHGADGAFENQRGSCHVVRDRIECDYFEYLDGRDLSECGYHQEYMFEYDWAEETNGWLMNQTNH